MINLLKSLSEIMRGRAIGGPTVYLRQPHRRDWRSWVALRSRSHAFLKPWEPTWPKDALTRKAFLRRLRAHALQSHSDAGYAFFVFRRNDDALLGGITVSNVLIKRIAGNVDALMAMGLQMLIGSIPLILGAWAMEEPTAIQWSFTFIGALVGLSLFGSALVYWLWFSVLEKAPLNRANAFSFLIPIFGLTMGALFYGESMGWPQLIGITLTVLGVGLVTRRGTRSVAVDQ